VQSSEALAVEPEPSR